jgi:hypothetical protein
MYGHLRLSEGQLDGVREYGAEGCDLRAVTSQETEHSYTIRRAMTYTFHHIRYG